MNDQAYTPKTLRHLLRRRDFSKHPDLRDEEALQVLLAETINRAEVGFQRFVPHNTTTLRQKTIYKLTALPDELVLRKASRNIRHLTGIKQQDRHHIVKNLISFLREGVPYHIYKLDIRSFYESIDARQVIADLAKVTPLSRTTHRVVETFFQTMTSQGVNGLPRGLSISATLAEASLQNFDKFVKAEPCVHFYARFVDDIIIVTSGQEVSEAFLQILDEQLPEQLQFKKSKMYNKAVPEAYHKPAAQPPDELADLEYLGYRLRVLNPPPGGRPGVKHNSRPVEVRIAAKKVARFKTRLVKALLHYGKNPDFTLLLDRVRFLTGNYELMDKATGLRNRSGIFYNYNLINNHDDLDTLDRFLRAALLSSSWPKMLQATSLLTARQRRQLLRCSFINGFNKKTQHTFSATRIEQICRCWAYEQ